MSFIRWLMDLVNPKGETDLLSEHNKMRSVYKLAPLVEDSKLTKLALDHACYMSRMKNLTHGTGENSFEARMKAAGIYVMSGENIAMCDCSVNQVMNMWENSAGHRNNILNPSFRKAGFGRVEQYWCVIFTA